MSLVPPKKTSSTALRPQARSSNKTSSTIKCPFIVCEHPVSLKSPSESRSHFDQHHKHDKLPHLTNNFMSKTQLFACTAMTCNASKQCYHTQASHTRHDNSAHKATTRSSLNLTLVKKHFSPDEHDLQQWRLSLSWIRNLGQAPPAQRTNHCAHPRRSQQALHHATPDKVVQLILAASIPCKNQDDDSTPQACNTSSIPFWNIFFIFNHLLLHKN
jgi:hypothetical protein